MRCFLCLLVLLCTPLAMAEEPATWLDLGSEASQIEAVSGHTPLLPTYSAAHHRHRHYPYLYATTELMILDAEATTGGRVTLSFDDSGTAGTEQSFRDGDGLSSLAYSPRFTLGAQIFRRLALQGRAFYVTDEVSDRQPDFVPGFTPLPTFNTTRQNDLLNAYTVDLELVHNFTIGKCKFDTMFGARQAHYDCESQVISFGVVTTGNFVNMNLANGCGFDGFGHTYGIMMRRQIGNSPLTAFVGARASRCDGTSDSFARAAGAVASNPSTPLVGAATVTRNNSDAVMHITELQAGVQWERALRCVPATVFVRTAYEYQDWDIDGPPTGGAGFGGTIGTLTTNSFSSASLGEMQLGGLSLATGINW
jgi:hypothetical protein